MEFIKTIAPVIVAGLVPVILILAIRKKRKSQDKTETYMSEGVALGICLGAGIGSALPSYLSYFISAGVLIGFLAGMHIKKQ